MNWKNWFGYRPKVSSDKAKGEGARRLNLVELEKRLLMSASPLGIFEADLAQEPQDQIDDPSNDFDWDQALAQQLDSISDHLDQIGQEYIFTDPGDADADNLEESQAEAIVADSATTDSPPLELIFVDAELDDLDTLLKSVDVSEANRTIVQLQRGEDGVKQISDYLRELGKPVDAIHVLTHGQAGQIALGSSTLSLESVSEYQSDLEDWSHYLSAEADILFYGCDVAANDQGTELLTLLGDWTGADIAASDDATGHVELAGDWDLEFTRGTISTELAFTAGQRESWYSVLDISTGLVAHYEFEEGSGTVAGDSTANNLDGTLNGATFGSGVLGTGGIDATGDNDHVAVADNAFFDFGSGNFSVGFWFKSSTVPGSDVQLVGQSNAGGDGWIFYANSSGQLNFFTVGTGGYVNLTSSGFFDGNWHQVSAVRSGDTFTLYVDGVQRAAQTLAVGTISSADALRMGSANGGGDFDGNLDDVRLYNRAISTTDVQTLFGVTNSISVTATSDLVNGSTTSFASLLANDGGDGISLREAIIAANNQSGSDTIQLSGTTYALTLTGAGENAGAQGDLDVTSAITLLGTGAESTAIDASGLADRVFHISGAGSLTMSDVTISGGTGGSYESGGVFNEGTFVATDVVLDGNSATNNGGGAINSTGTTTLTRVSLINNLANNAGALLVNGGTTTLTNVTISGNQSTYDGGGIRVASGTLNVHYTTIANNNAASGNGGGIQVGGGTVNLYDSIVVNNRSMYGGADVNGTLTTNSNNIIEDNNGVIGGDANLGQLSYDSASGQYYHAITNSSSAHDAGVGTAPATDQIGVARDGSADIGAYEYYPEGPSDLIVTSTAEGGYSLNHDGGNDAYFIADDGGSILGGLSAFTMEFQFASNSIVDQTTFFSYATSGQSNALLAIVAGTSLQLHIAGANYIFTGYDITTLSDGKKHGMAITWNGSTGAASLVVDGQVKSTISGVATGQSIQAGGTLVFGQEQDSVDGGYVNTQIFNGTYHDIRVFSDIRTTQEIQANYLSDLRRDEAGMVANWKFDQISTDGIVIDAVSGNNLSLSQVNQGGFTSSDTSLSFTVKENSLTGQVVGSIAGLDLERQSQISEHLASDPQLVYNSVTGKFYKLVSTADTWTAAQSAAVSSTLSGITGQLLTVTSAYENDLAQGFATSVGGDIWLGISDQVVEGTWQLYSGTTAGSAVWQATGTGVGYSVNGGYANWNTGEPNNDGDQDAAKIYQASGKWDDSLIGSTARYVVEWDADQVLNATESLSYNITSQTVAGAFAIDSTSGQITIANGSLLDYETNALHSLSIRVTDNDGSFYDEVFSVAIEDLIETNSSPTDLSSGIEVNNDGGNDTFLEVTSSGSAGDIGDVLGGLDAFTLEFNFSAADMGRQTLLSYAATDVDGNDILVRVGESGGYGYVLLTINGSTNQITPYSIPYDDILLDGQQHHLAISWDNSAGDWAIYVDGEFIESGTGLAAGQTLSGNASTGHLVIGNEQDSYGGGYQSNDTFRGTLYDVRIWNEARSAAEISTNYRQKIDVGSLPTSLVANWQMDGFNGSSQVVDVVGGNNLSVATASGAGFVSSATVDDLRIDEGSTAGTTVGYVDVADPDSVNDIANDGRFSDYSSAGDQYGVTGTFGGWTVTSGSVDVFAAATWESMLGGRLVNLDGGSPGAIEQSLATVAGQTYQVIFSVTGDFSAGDVVKSLRVGAAGQSIDYTISQPSNWAWGETNALETRSFTFTADSSSTALSFTSLGSSGSQYGPYVGDIRVIAIPPEVNAILNSDPTLQYDASTQKFYRVVTSAENFATASANAESSLINGVSGQLLTIGSEYENTVVHSMIDGLGVDIWLGLSDATTEGDWHWLNHGTDGDLIWTGTSAGTGYGYYTNWGGGEPNNSGGNEDHAEIRSATGLWNDINAGDYNSYIVEWDVQEILSSYTFSLTDDAGGRFAIDSSTGEITYTGTGSLDYELATSHDISVQVTDVSGNSYIEAMTIAVDNLEDDASLSVPGGQSVSEDTALVFSSGNGNAIVVTNGSSDNPLMTVNLSVVNGSLTLANLTGITFLEGTANGQGTLSIQGTEADINTALDGLQYQGTANFNGSDTLTVTTGSDASLEANVYARYEFFEGELTDSSGNGYDGTASGDPLLDRDAGRGDVMTFDGDDLVTVAGGTAGLGQQVTIAAWVNLDAGATDAVFLSIGDEFYITLDPANTSLGMELTANGFTTSSTNSVNRIGGEGWHHVAATINDVTNELNLYLDGVLIKNRIHDFGDINWGTATSPNITIGGLSSGASFIGSMDDVRVYTSELTASEIVTVMGDNGYATGSVSISVNAVNDAPVLTPWNPPFNTNEDAAAIMANVAAVLQSSVTDADGNPEGVAVYGITGNVGVLEYSLNGGATWQVFSAVSENSALLLRDSDLFRFTPNSDNGGTMTLNYYAWDQTSGTAGSSVDVTTRGGLTAFSSTGDAVTINSANINDEQVLATNLGANFDENSTGNVISTAMLEATDVDTTDTPDQLVYTITSTTTYGTLRRSGTALGLSDTFTQQDINDGLITYDHDGSENFTDSFGFSLDDGEGAATSGTFSLTLNPVNDQTVSITSDGGGGSASISVNETISFVTQVTVADGDLPGDTMTYAIIGGSDQNDFTIDSSGNLTFVAAPDYEAPVDGDTNNVYTVTVQVSDGLHTDTQTITVNVQDVQSTSLVVTTTSDVDDTGLGSSYNIEQLYAVGGGADGYISLREAIIAANNTLGTDTIEFAILTGDAGYTGTSGVDAHWQIVLTDILPTITEALVLDAASQTLFAGDVNPGTFSAVTQVGVNNTAIAAVDRPEVAIIGNSGLAGGLLVSADNVTISGFAMYGFSSSQAIELSDGFNNATISSNVFGMTASSFSDPGAALNNFIHVKTSGADNGILSNNLMAYSLSAAFHASNASDGWSLTGNQVVDGGLNFSNGDGFGFSGTTGAMIDGNYFSGMSTQAIFAGGSSSNITITNNTVINSGIGPVSGSHVQYDAIAFRSGVNNITISHNVIADNYGAGITVNDGAYAIEISQNSIYGNGTVLSRQGVAASGLVGIDLQASGDNTSYGTAPYYTANDAGDADTGGNSLQNFPVILSASSDGTRLDLSGTFNSLASRSYRLEFFLSDSYANGHGQGETYLGSITVTTDGSGNATYSTTFTAPIPTGVQLTATATDLTTNETSEFSQQFAINDAPHLLGDNLVTNSDFDTDLSDWTTSGNVDWSGGEVRFGQIGGANGVISQTLTTEIGKEYFVTFLYGDKNASDSQSILLEAIGGSQLLSAAIQSGVASATLEGYTYSFVADSTSTTISFTDTSASHSGVRGYLDGIEVRANAGATASAAYAENDSPLDLLNDFNLADVDDTNLESAVVTLSANYVQGEDILIFVDFGNIVGNWDAVAGTMTLSGSDTVANYELALRSITYSNTSEDPSTATRTITVVVNDGEEDSNVQSRDLTVTAVNDAPVLDNSGTMTLTSITEDETSNTGNTVAEILASAGGDRVTDVDSGASEGIAITARNNGNGQWEYQLDGTSTWLSVGTVSEAQALLLRSTDRLRFLPDGENGITQTVDFRAWDQTSGSAGAKVDVTTNGGTTAFSTATESASVTVTDVNDAPTVSNASTISLAGTNEDTTSSPTNVGDLLTSASWGDVDDGSIKGIAITGLSGNGTWQYSTDGSWTTISGVSAANALLLTDTAQVRYIPDGANGETAQFTFKSWDQTTGVAATSSVPAFADTSTDGGTTAYSATVVTAEVVVSDVNDPISANSDSGTAVEAGGVANATAGSNPTGNVLTNDSDVDTGDTMSVTGVAAGTVSTPTGNVNTTVVGAYGSIVIASDGSYTYTVDNSNAAVQALRTSGDTLTDTFTYTATDGSGANTSTQIVLTIQGQNDDPTAVADSATAIEAGGDGNATVGTDPTGNVLTNDNDVDAGDTKTVVGVAAGAVGSAAGNVASSVVGSYGSITINSDGSYTYSVDNSNAAVQALRTSGDSLQDVFTYSMQDASGAESTTQITVTITGQNDDPGAADDTATAVEAGGVANGTAGSDPTGNVLTNDTDVDGSDTKTVVGVAAGSQVSTAGSVGSSVNGSYGSITINSDGSYSYVVDNSNAAVQALRTVSDTLTEVFTYTMQDAAGADSTAEITITITGSDDAPVAVANTATAIEASGINNNISGTDPTGNVLTNDTDVDAGDTKTVVGVATGVQASTSGSVGSSVTGTYGSITINSDGTYVYVVDNDNAMVDALVDGQSLNETFSYTLRDSSGQESTTQITVTIDGRTDMPVAEADMATAVEDGGYANATTGSDPSGNVLDNDSTNNGKEVIGVAAGSTGTASGNVGVSVVGTYGTVVINSDGTYTYTLDNTNPAVQALLTSGDHVTDVFTYTMEDDFLNVSSTELTITVDGQNDAVVAVSDAGTATEAGGLNNSVAGSNATGNVVSNDTDVDSGDTKTVVGVAAGVQGSAAGSVGVSVTGNYGYIVINNDGTYTYVIDENNATVQALGVGDSTTDVFTYTVEDTAGLSSTTQITITIQGANDTGTAVADAASAVEAGGAANGTAGTDPTGNVLTNDADPDNGDSQSVIGVAAGVQGSAAGSVGSSVVGTYGTITIQSDGSYVYNVDNNNAAVQALRTSGQSVTDTFTYTMQDSGGATSTTQIVVTVSGANDDVVAVGDTAVAVEASGTANGTAGTNPTGNVLTNDTDVDSGDTKTVSGVAAGVVGSTSGSVGSNVSGSYGSITINSDGSYSYVVDNNNAAVQALLSSGDTLTDTFSYTVMDTAGGSSTTQIAITIQGADDAPESSSDTGTATESGGVSNGTAGSDATGNVLANDAPIDAGDSWTVDGVAAGSVGTQTGNVGSAVTGNYGSITINSDGSYTYVIDETNPTVEALRTSTNTLTDTFTYTVKDAGGQTSTTQIVLTIQGANDTPVAVLDTSIAVEASGAGNSVAGTNPSGNVLTNDTDIDAGDSKTVSGVAAGVQASTSGSVGSSVVGSYGSITINSDGSYTYVVDNNNATVQALLTSGDTVVDTFSYTMVDTAGATSTTQINVTIQGGNDDATAVDDAATAVESYGENNSTAGSNATGNVLTNDTDLDSGDSHSVIGVAAGNQSSASGSVGSSVVGTYGSITIDANGNFTFVVDENNAAVQALRNSGQSLQDVFTYTMQDAGGLDSTAQVTITILGSNDTPVAVSDAATAVEAGGVANATAGTDPTGNVLTNDTDVDSGDSKSVLGVAAGIQGSASGNVGAAVTGSYGSITINSDGSYTYNVDNSNAAVEALRTSGDTLQDVFTYTMQDGAGNPNTTTITVTIQGSNDAPVAVADSGTAVESGGIANATAGSDATGNVLTNDTDIDAGDSKTVNGVAAGIQGSTSGNVSSPVAGSYGSVTINGDGSYTYVVDESNAAVQALRTASDSLQDVFSYTFTDAAGETGTAQVTITIQGSNDNPHDMSTTGLTVQENSTNSTVVGTIVSSDVDAGDTATYTMVDGDNGRFSIDANGTVRVADGSQLDYENATSHTIVVRVTDASGATYDESFTVSITDQDEFDVGSISDVNAAANTVSEAAGIGTAVGVTANAVDADGTNNTVTYTLDDDAGGLFAIDTNTGVVTVAAGLDYETATSHSILVRANSSDGSSSTQSFTINLTDADEFNVSPVTDSDAAANYVLENSANGTTVGITSLATDQDGTDTVTYSLDDDASGRFAIDANTGVVTVAGAIDREAAASYAITIRATSTDSSFSTQTFTINVGDVDEFDVSTPTDSDAAVNQVNENVAIGTSVGLTADAFDLDATNNTISYSLSSNPDGLFQIDSSTGVVTTAASIDREAHGSSRSITVTAISSDGSTASQIFTIAINDVDEFDVTTPSDTDATVNAVDENSSVGTTVGVTAFASDADATTNAVSYSLDDDASGRFSIDSSTGVVTVAGALDYENLSSHSIVVRATSADGSFATQTISIAVNDVNEFAVGPVSDVNASTNTVAENSANGTVVGVTANAVDADGTAVVSYSLDDDAGARFAIDSSTGIVTVAGAIDREAAGSYDIVIRATSDDGSFSTATVTINVSDVNEFSTSANTDANAAANFVVENSSVGSTVGVVAFSDDFDATDSVTYSLDNNSGGQFAINSTTGVVTVVGPIDRESGASRSITVRATSTDGSFVTAVYSIAIGDVDEFDVTAIADANAAAEVVAENASIGTTVGFTASASDADATTNSISYSLTSNPGSLFAVNVSSGIVTVAGALDYETATSHTLTVRATSADGSFSDHTFVVLVTDINEYAATVSVDTDAAANQVNEHATVGTNVGVTALADDFDGTDSVTYSLSDSAGGRFAINSTTGVVQLAGALDYEKFASHTIMVRALSSDGSFTDTAFTINVVDQNDVPTNIVISNNTIVENPTIGQVVGQLQAVDQDSWDSHSYQIISGSGVGTFQLDSSGRVVVASTNINYEAQNQYTLTVRATDLAGTWVDQTITVQVVDANDLPVAVNDSFVVAEDQQLSGNVIAGSDSDQDGDVLTAQLISGPANAASFTLNGDGTFSYVGARDFNGVDTFQYRVNDGQGNSEVATVQITVTPVNDAPVGVNDVYLMNQAETLQVLVNGVLNNDYDVDVDPLIAIVVQQPAHGTLVFQPDGTFKYQPDKTFFGSDEFTYVANDGTVNGNVVRVQIVIQGLDNSGQNSTETPTNTNSSNSNNNNAGTSNQGDLDKSLAAVDANLVEEKTVTKETIESQPEAEATTGANEQPAEVDQPAQQAHALPTTKDAAGVLERLLNSAQSDSLLKLSELELELREMDAISISFDANRLWGMTNERSSERDTNELDSHTFFENSLVTGSIVAAAGYALWTLRGGVLVATMMTTLPSWKFVDPLPVLDSFGGDMDGEDAESIQSMLDNASDDLGES